MSFSTGPRRGRVLLSTAAAALGTLALAAAASAAPTATITAGTYDFGNRQAGAGVSTSKTYTVTATGTEDVVVGAVSLTGDTGQFGFFSDGCTGKTLNAVAAGGTKTCTISPVFSPTTTGVKSATLQVVTNGPTLTTGAMTGTGRRLESSPSVLDFGAAAAGSTSAERLVTITNRDTAPYPLGAMTIASANATQWTISSNTCASATLAADASCTVGVKFLPTGATEAKNSTLNVGPASGAGSLGAPITLAGEAGQPAVAIGPATHVFGTRALGAGASPAQTITVTNTGNLPLVIGAVGLLDGTGPHPDPDQFAIAATTCRNATVAPGASCAVDVTFDPETAGWHSAALRLVTNAATSRAYAAVSGRGDGDVVDGPAPTGPVDLLAQPIARFQGDGGDGATAVASGPCDLTGSGHGDLVIGASLWSSTPATRSWEGAVYVSPGGTSVGSTDLADRGAGTILIEGEKAQPGQTAGNQTGSVACADVNGDGYDDVVIGAWAYQYPGRLAGTAASRGAAYVVYGSKDFFALPAPDLSNLGARGFRIEGGDGGHPTTGLEEYDHLGYAVANLGDLNHDGREEIGVMANTGDTTTATPARTNNGLVFVVPGRTGTTTVDVDDPSQTLLRINGASPGSNAAPFGQMIGLAGIGDVNGDGRQDIGIGTYTAVTFGRSTASGAAFAISGKARGDIDLAEPDSYLFAVGGAFAGHRLGMSLAAAGDVNGDGVGDLVIGADSTSAANTSAAYVVYGAAAPRTGAGALGILDSADLGARGYRLMGPLGSHTGYAVDGAGDVNGDGYDDVLVGAYAATTAAGAGTGSAWVAYGVPDPTVLPVNDATSGLVPVNAADRTRYQVLAALTPAQGTRIDGLTAGERFGRSLARVGDLVGDGGTALAFGSDAAFRYHRTGGGEVAVALLAGAPLPGPKVPAPDPDPAPAPDPNPGPGPGPVLDLAPAATVAPALTGRKAAGSVLTCGPGVWAGRPAPVLAYAWLRGAVRIPNATGSTYVTTSRDVASAIACEVTASNGAGTASRRSAATVTVTQARTITARQTAGQAGSAVVAIVRSVKVASSGKAALGTVSCLRAGAKMCTASVALTVKLGSKRYTATGRASLAQGHKASLRVRLPAAARAALRRGAKGTATVKVTVVDDTRVRGSLSGSVAVKRA